jgi:hypothetical protein
MTIRNAVIVSLVKLGFNQSEVMKDVKLFSGKSPLFTKAVKLNNAEKYTSTWSSEFNSETGKKDGLTSPEISNTGYALKFYSTKGKMNNVNAVGIVKSGMIEHIIEAGLEKIERKLFNEFADEDPIYDMHYENAKGFFKKVKKQ